MLQIFKLSQGEYIVPQRVEGAYKQSPLLAQVFIYGDSARSYLVGVAVPEEQPFVAAAKDAGFEGKYLGLCSQPGISQWLLAQLAVQAENEGLQVTLLSIAWTELPSSCLFAD